MTAERFTVVLTGFLSTRKPGEYLYLIMNDDPVQIGGGGALRRGRPPSERLRREIPFQNLPEGCRRLALEVYRGLWGL